MQLQLKQDPPKPRYENMDELRACFIQLCLHANHERADDPTYFPCFKCGAKGQVRKHEDRDPVEGYKNAPWHSCEHCGGKGEATKEEYEEILEHELQRYERDQVLYKNKLARLEQLKANMNEDDIIFLLDHTTYR